PTDTGNLSVNIRLPLGTAIETTDKIMHQVDGILASDPDVDAYITGSGFNFRGGGGSPSSPNVGGGSIQLKRQRKNPTAAVVRRLQAKFRAIPGARVQVTPFDIVANIIGGNTLGLTVDVYGNDLNQLSATAHDVQAALENIPGLTGVDTSLQDTTP